MTGTADVRATRPNAVLRAGRWCFSWQPASPIEAVMFACLARPFRRGDGSLDPVDGERLRALVAELGPVQWPGRLHAPTCPQNRHGQHVLCTCSPHWLYALPGFDAFVVTVDAGPHGTFREPTDGDMLALVERGARA